jgi:hypothetical protein
LERRRGLVEQAETMQTMLRELASKSDELVDCLKQRASRPGTRRTAMATERNGSTR